MTTGRINQVSASPPTPAKSSTPPSQSSRRNTQGGAPPSQKQWFALSELKSSNPAPPRGGTPQCCLHLLAHQPKHRGFKQHSMPRPVSKASPKAANFSEEKLPSEYKHTSSSCSRRCSACMQHSATKSTTHPFWGKSKRRTVTNQLI